MLRTPIWATASLLAVAISLAGCGEDKTPTNQTAAPQSTTESVPAEQAQKPDEKAAKAVVSHYADLALAVFSDAHATAVQLQQAIDALLANPSEETLQAARQAWLAARVPYMQTGCSASATRWWTSGRPAQRRPLDEGLIDYVEGDYQHALGNPGANANIIANTELQVGEDKIDTSEITAELLTSLNELAGSGANVATGYHAIEFLLWGGTSTAPVPVRASGRTPTTSKAKAAPAATVTVAVLSEGGHRPAGQRSAGDGRAVAAGRRELSRQPGSRIGGERPAQDAVRHGSLSLGELAGERMRSPWRPIPPKTRHDCFSDNTHNSHFYNARGIRNVYLGEYKRVDGSTLTGRAWPRWSGA